MLVYLVDNSPADALRALAGRFGVHYRHRPDNPGHARAHNLTLRDAIAYHFVLHADIQIPLDAIGKLLPHPLELLVRRFFPLLHSSSGRLARYELHGSGYTRVMDVPALSGCFLLMRIETLRRVGLFDERFLLYFEDVDLSRRVGRVARTVFVPHVAVVHDCGRGAYRDWRLFGQHLVSAARYFNKWGWLRDEERARVNARTLRAAYPERAGQPGGRPAGTDLRP